MSTTVEDLINGSITYTYTVVGSDIILNSMSYIYDAYNFNAQHTVATLPLNITEISEDFAYANAPGNSNFHYISELVIGENVKTFKKNLFRNWTRLTTLTINIIDWSNISFDYGTVLDYPDIWGDPTYSEEVPNPLSFDGCINLVNLYIQPDSYEYTDHPPNTPTLFDGFFKNWLGKIKNIYYLSGKTSISIFNVASVRPSTELSSGQYFNITSVTIPQSVITIGQGVFTQYKQIETVNFLEPSAVKIIADQAFMEIDTLKNVSLPSSLEKIGIRAFKNTKITSLIIPKSITEIGFNAFIGCNDLTSVVFSTLNFDLTNFASNNIFSGCTALTDIRFPNRS